MRKTLHPQQIKDLKLGNKEERRLKPDIEKLVKTRLTISRGGCNYDYYNYDKSILVELKSRRVKKLQYKDTIIPLFKWNKLKKLYLDGAEIYYVFNFTDSLSYLKFSNQDYKTCFITRRDRGKIERKEHIEIPVCDLIDYL